MNSSKKDKGRIIKRALLFSEELTKKEVSIAIFVHALMIALIVVSAFLPPLPQLIGVIGVLWFASITQKLVIELTNNSERYIWQVVNQVFRRVGSPAKSDKLMAIVAGIIAGLIFIGFLIAAFASDALWLTGVAFWGPIVVMFAFAAWRIWSIARQVKAQRLQQETA